MTGVRGVVRSPLLDLVRLTPVLRRGPGAGAVPMDLVATGPDAAVLASVLGPESLAICPLCPVRSVAPGELAATLGGLLDGSARVVIVGASTVSGTVHEGRLLDQTLDRAAELGVPVVAAAGPHPTTLTRHAWVVPVSSCTASGRVSWFVDLDHEPRGLLAPGEEVPGPHGPASGNGVAATVVAGAAALLWSLFPAATGGQVRSALLIGATHPRRWGPPLLDAERAYEFLARGMA
ncbi:hypothetical protein [Actinokineospora sp.]|uniref:hypothetical protein n=1 Tax=Actinokineospora sp. TaxID=1872133 RepID=UPI004037CF0D